MFKIGDKVKYIGNSGVVNSILTLNNVYIVTYVSDSNGLALAGFDDYTSHYYMFCETLFTLEKGIDYLAITRQFG